jgi:predicted double-glycine peptidase
MGAFRGVALLGTTAWLVLASAGFASAGQIPIESAGTSFNVPITTFKEMHYRRVVHQRYDYSCGSAALATLLTYHYERPTLESTALKWMFAHGDQEKIRKEGFSLLDMKRYLSSIGLDGEGYRVTLDKIAKVGIPGIILVNVKGYSHFVVLKGIRGDKVLIGDPALGARLMTRKDIERIWTGVFFTVVSDVKEAKSEFNRKDDWASQASAPLGWAMSRQSLSSVTLLLPSAQSF